MRGFKQMWLKEKETERKRRTCDRYKRGERTLEGKI